MGYDGPSISGYHFVQLYQNCKRKFKDQVLDGLEPMHHSPAVLLGTAGHAGLEAWYRQHQLGSPITKKIKFATDAAISDLETRRDQYIDKSKYESHKLQLIDTFQEYALAYSDEPFKVLDIELGLETTLKWGDVLTGRLDLTTLRNDGSRWVMDHKFTGWSIDLFARSVKVSDQATAYTLLHNRNFPNKPVSGVMFNIIRNYQGRLDFRQVPVYRSIGDVDLFEAEVSDNFREMAQRIVDPNATWPKNTDHCYSFNTACPFLELCQGVKFDGLIGVKFKRKESVRE